MPAEPNKTTRTPINPDRWELDMMNVNEGRRRFLALSAGAVAASAVGPVARAASGAIKIGVGSDPVFTGFYLADQQGLFKAEGLDVTLQFYADGGEAMNALVAQQVDVSAASEPTTLIRLTRADLRPLSICYQSGRYIKLVLGKAVASPKDIRKMGIVPGSVSQYCAGLAISKLGLDASAVKFVPSGPPELPALLARGDIDAFFAWEPWPSKAVEQGGKVAMTSGDVGYRDTIWVTSTAALFKSNPDGLRAMLRALAKASQIATADPKQAAAAVKKATRLPEEASLAILAQMTLVVRDFGEDDLKSYDGIATFLAENNVTKGPVPYRDVMQLGFYKG